jgi:hypothetical protein
MIQLKAAPGYGAACVCFLINFSYICLDIFLSQNKAAPCLWPAVVIGTQILCFRDNGFIFDYIILKYDFIYCTILLKNNLVSGRFVLFEL